MQNAWQNRTCVLQWLVETNLFMYINVLSAYTGHIALPLIIAEIASFLEKRSDGAIIQ